MGSKAKEALKKKAIIDGEIKTLEAELPKIVDASKKDLQKLKIE